MHSHEVCRVRGSKNTVNRVTGYDMETAVSNKSSRERCSGRKRKGKEGHLIGAVEESNVALGEE